MRLIRLIEDARQWDDDDDTTIYVARPWAPDAEAILVSPSPETIEAVVRDGRSYDYFLETFIAREVLEDYVGSNDGASRSALERCQRLIYYAENDA